MSVRLSSGALKAINDGTQVEKPVFQLLALKKLNPTTSTNNAVDRWRILLSDGIHNNSAMLAVQLNQLVADGKLDANTVVSLDRYVCNTVAGNRRVVIVLELTIVANASQAGGKIGNPVALIPASGGTNGQAAPAPQQTPQMRTGASPMSVPKANSFPGASSFNKQPQGGFGGMSPPKQAQPISSLTPYQNRWTIKARVSNKSSVRTWSNSRGEGKLFSMDLCDQSGEIRATAFKDQCDKFFDLIEVGKVYFIGRGTLKTANRQYTSITNDYEMTFNNDTTVIPCDEEDSSIPTMKFDFRAINQLEEMNKDTILEIVAAEENAASAGTPAASKPTATVSPVATVSPNPAAIPPQPPSTQENIRVIHGDPGAAGRPTNQHRLPGFPVFTAQRHPGPGMPPVPGMHPGQGMPPGPGMPPQVFVNQVPAPMIRIVHHHPDIDPRAPPPPTSGSTSTTAPSVTTTGSTSQTFQMTGAGQAFQIQFHHRPGYSPQPIIRFMQDPPPPPPPGTHRCTHAHHGHPVFQTPNQTQPNPPFNPHQNPGSSTPAPRPCPVHSGSSGHIHALANPPQHPGGSQAPPCRFHQAAASGQPPAQPQTKPKDDKPELAELAQRVQNIAAVKTVKPGSRGMPVDPRLKQRRAAEEAANNRRKEIKAKSKALKTEQTGAVPKMEATPEEANGKESASVDKSVPEEEAPGTSISIDSTRRRKRRKRIKQSPTPEESVDCIPKESNLPENKTPEPSTERTELTGNSVNDRVDSKIKSGSNLGVVERPEYDSDDTSSDSESEDVSKHDTEIKETAEATSKISPEISRSQLNSSLPEDKTDQAQELERKGDLNADGSSASQTGSVDQILPTKNVSHKDSSPQAELLVEELATKDIEENELAHPSSELNEEMNLEKQAKSGLQNVSDPIPTTQTTSDVPVRSQTTSLTPELAENESKPAKKLVQDFVQDPRDVDKKSKPSENDSKKSGGAKSTFDSGSDCVSLKSTDENVLKTTEDSSDAGSQKQTKKTKSSNAQEQITKPKAKSSKKTSSSSAKLANSGPECHPNENLRNSGALHDPSTPQDDYQELQPDHLEVERKQLALERKRLNCERQHLLLEEEKVQLEQDRLKTERERLEVFLKQVKLQGDQLDVDRERLHLEREQLMVDRERLQVERQSLEKQEQRGEDSKMILRSLQEISQTLQMSVSLSLQGYGFPMSFSSSGNATASAAAAAESYMEDGGFLERGTDLQWSQTLSPEGAAANSFQVNHEEQSLNDLDEWTVVGGPRRRGVHGVAQELLSTDVAELSQEIDDALDGAGDTSVTIQPALEKASDSSADHVPRSEDKAKKGERPRSKQRSDEGRRSSPVHELSDIQRRPRQDPNRREHTSGRYDSKRGRNNIKRR